MFYLSIVFVELISGHKIQTRQTSSVIPLPLFKHGQGSYLHTKNIVQISVCHSCEFDRWTVCAIHSDSPQTAMVLTVQVTAVG